MPESNIDLLRRGYAMFDLQRAASGELDAIFQEVIDPDFELRVPANYPDLDRGRGLEAVRGMLRMLAEVWEEWRLEPETWFEGDERIVVFTRLVARARGSGAEVTARGAHLWRFREGKLLSNEVFLDQGAALGAAGLEGVAPKPFESGLSR